MVKDITMDVLGRIVVPRDMRKELGVSAGDVIQLKGDQARIIITKKAHSCVICHSETDLFFFKEKPICAACHEALKT